MIILLARETTAAGRLPPRDKHQIRRNVQLRRSGCNNGGAWAACGGNHIPGPGLDEENCVNKCLSPTCYEEVYDSEPVRRAKIIGFIGKAISMGPLCKTHHSADMLSHVACGFRLT